MLVSKKPHGPNVNFRRPNASSNVSQWNIVLVGYARVGFALGMLISCGLSCFCLHWVPNAISGGVRA